MLVADLLRLRVDLRILIVAVEPAADDVEIAIPVGVRAVAARVIVVGQVIAVVVDLVVAVIVVVVLYSSGIDGEFHIVAVVAIEESIAVAVDSAAKLVRADVGDGRSIIISVDIAQGPVHVLQGVQEHIVRPCVDTRRRAEDMVVVVDVPRDLIRAVRVEEEGIGGDPLHLLRAARTKVGRRVSPNIIVEYLCSRPRKTPYTSGLLGGFILDDDVVHQEGFSGRV